MAFSIALVLDHEVDGVQLKRMKGVARPGLGLD
jgi:hypothetical protein